MSWSLTPVSSPFPAGPMAQTVEQLRYVAALDWHGCNSVLIAASLQLASLDDRQQGRPLGPHLAWPTDSPLAVPHPETGSSPSQARLSRAVETHARHLGPPGLGSGVRGRTGQPVVRDRRRRPGHQGEPRPPSFETITSLIHVASRVRRSGTWHQESSRSRSPVTSRPSAASPSLLVRRISSRAQRTRSDEITFSASCDRTLILFPPAQMVKCWDLETNKVIRHYHGHLSGVYSLACVSLTSWTRHSSSLDADGSRFTQSPPDARCPRHCRSRCLRSRAYPAQRGDLCCPQALILTN